MKFSTTGQDTGDLLNKGDCLIEGTTWAGLTVYQTSKMQYFSIKYILVL